MGHISLTVHTELLKQYDGTSVIITYTDEDRLSFSSCSHDLSADLTDAIIVDGLVSSMGSDRVICLRPVYSQQISTEEIPHLQDAERYDHISLPLTLMRHV